MWTVGNDSNIMIGLTESWSITTIAGKRYNLASLLNLYKIALDLSRITVSDFHRSHGSTKILCDAQPSESEIGKLKKTLFFQKSECSRFHLFDFCNKRVLRDNKSKNKKWKKKL